MKQGIVKEDFVSLVAFGELVGRKVVRIVRVCFQVARQKVSTKRIFGCVGDVHRFDLASLLPASIVSLGRALWERAILFH